MTAAVGFPTLRLIRSSIGDWALDIPGIKIEQSQCFGLQPGESIKLQVEIPQTLMLRNQGTGAKGHKVGGHKSGSSRPMRANNPQSRPAKPTKRGTRRNHKKP